MCLKLLQDSCSEAMIRLFVFFLNFLFIIVGVALACIGIWMEVEYTKIEVCGLFMISPVFCHHVRFALITLDDHFFGPIRYPNFSPEF